jgi:hypothetical protein
MNVIHGKQAAHHYHRAILVGIVLRFESMVTKLLTSGADNIVVFTEDLLKFRCKTPRTSNTPHGCSKVVGTQ